MGGTADYLALRIVYGAAMSMGLIEKGLLWKNFVKMFSKEFKDAESDVLAAVELLQRIFGENRRVLILVDEVSKSKKSITNLSNLGLILDESDRFDVLVSSLSANYVDKLVTGSQRSINYEYLRPMLDARLGEKEYQNWAKSLIEKAESPMIVEKVDIFKKNALYNFYLLYSGHPRALERMKQAMEDPRRDWSKIITALQDSNISVVQLIFLLTRELPSYNCFTPGFPNADIENYVFRNPAVSFLADNHFRALTESGK